MDRQTPQDISVRPFDVVVVGAGINGAGIARDAAMRGLKVLLLDKEDISSGTTQWSTRLIHGGLRYLEQYEFSLVRESLKDREILLRMAPHLVRPLGFLVPIYEYMEHGRVMIQLGMMAYDALSIEKSVERHRIFDREQTLEREPGLNPEGLKGAAFYYDAQSEYPERIVVENAVSARDHGAVVLTYAKVDRLIVEDGNVTGVEFEDALSGERHAARAPVTVNAAGPWVDEVLGGMDRYSEERMIGGTKGSHLVVDPFPGAPKTALYVEARENGRPYFIVPWNGRYLIGTTDIRYEGDLDCVMADDEEIDYLLEETNHVIPEANLTRDDILFTYSGVRPLPHEPEGAEGSVSRGHIIYDHSEKDPRIGGFLSIIGGKLTTYRNEVPLPGGTTEDFETFAEEFRAESDLAEELAERLLKLYGACAPDVLEIAGEDPSLREPLASPFSVETGIIGAEVLYAFRRELAQKLGDVLLRRTMVGMGPRVGLDVDKASARVAARHLGWTEERAEREVEEYRDYVQRYKPKEFREREPARA
jgi:glycerol-3-phosphate dehydrogenase